MKAHPWPGNVRELKNVVERCVVFGKNEIIQVEDLLFASLGRSAWKAPDAFQALEELERDHIAPAPHDGSRSHRGFLLPTARIPFGKSSIGMTYGESGDI